MWGVAAAAAWRRVSDHAADGRALFLPVSAQLYRFLSRRTDSKFNKTVLKRLFMSKMNRPPMNISQLMKFAAKDYNKGKILVCVGKVLDDERKLDLPAMRVCALTFSETARARITKAGGQCMTFDQVCCLPVCQPAAAAAACQQLGGVHADGRTGARAGAG